MKNPVNLPLIIMALCFQPTFAQISFQKQYGASTMDEHGMSVVQTADSSYYVSGVRVSGSLPNIIGEAMLTHTDKYGNEIWTKYYSATSADGLNFYCIGETSDNKLIVAGTVTYDYAGDYYDVYLSKIDLNGNVLWYKTYGEAYGQRGFQVKETYDGGYIIGGWDRIDGSANSISFHLIKTNSVGDTLWTRTYPGEGGARLAGVAVEQTLDSSYVAVGNISPSSTATYIYVMKTNSIGDTLWTKTIDYPGTGEAKDIEIANNGNIVISGWTTSTGCQAYILIELDQNGNIVWLKNYNTGYCAWNSSLCKTKDNGYAIFGMNTNYDYYLVKTDSVGNQQWFEKFDKNLEYAYDVKQTFDGGYIMAGDTYISNDSNVDLFLVKTDSLGNVLNTIDNPDDFSGFSFYPNPAKETLFLKTTGDFYIQKIKLLDMQGRIIEEYSRKTRKLDIGKLATGNYFLQVFTDQGKTTKKVIVE